jgi:hypothetical protein
MRRLIPVLIAAGLLSARPASADDATAPGEPRLPYPTVTQLSIEWPIDGDDDLDGVVTPAFRAAGQTAWRAGLPLRRVPAGRNDGVRPPRTWTNTHSGSLFDLQPGTEYEVRLTLTDPDGGNTERSLRARTRPEPRVPSDAPRIAVTPDTLQAAADAALPGQVLQLAPGRYNLLRVTRDGTPEAPIVFRSDGGAVVDGVLLLDRRHVWLEGLTVEGSVNLHGAESCVVRRCTVRARFGIIANAPPGCRECVITDNVVEGVEPWRASLMGGGRGTVGEGIQLTGPGNVIAFNRVRGFRDAISLLEDELADEQTSIDILNNDISVALDDAIEADFCAGNCRVMRNRITNAFVGVSSQPSLGGPTYIIRNVMYNLAYVPYKLHRGSEGDVVLHNTVVKMGDGAACRTEDPWRRAMLRNNLAVGGPGGPVNGFSSGRGRAAQFPAADASCEFDYNGYGTWRMGFSGMIGGRPFRGLRGLRRIEPHAVRVGLDAFAARVRFPSPLVPEREPADLRLAAGTAAVDAGALLPTVNDGFAGDAPDLGAYELGQPTPWYGPRPPEDLPAVTEFRTRPAP